MFELEPFLLNISYNISEHTFNRIGRMLCSPKIINGLKIDFWSFRKSVFIQCNGIECVKQSQRRMFRLLQSLGLIKHEAVIWFRNILTSLFCWLINWFNVKDIIDREFGFYIFSIFIHFCVR